MRHPNGHWAVALECGEKWVVGSALAVVRKRETAGSLLNRDQERAHTPQNLFLAPRVFLEGVESVSFSLRFPAALLRFMDEIRDVHDAYGDTSSTTRTRSAARARSISGAARRVRTHEDYARLGSRPSIIKSMGLKHFARAIAQQADVPCIPGSVVCA